jgi:hypothetical protein
MWSDAASWEANLCADGGRAAEFNHAFNVSDRGFRLAGASPIDASPIEASCGSPQQGSDPKGHPDYRTIEDSSQNIAPMTSKEKWHLAWKSVTDPLNIGSAALGAAWSQATSTTPKYSHGGGALAQRFGAAIGDFTSQTFFSTGIFATVHQDPRYFRKVRCSSFLVRVADSLKQIVVARQDSGVKTFNASNFLGMAAGIGFSNLYYPLPAGPGRSCWAGWLRASRGCDG